MEGNILKNFNVQHLYMGRTVPEDTNRLNEFKTNDIFGIGWRNLPDLHGKTKDEIEKELAANNYSTSNVTVGMVNHIVNNIKIGDGLLLVDSDDVYVTIVESEYYFDPGKVADGFPHQIKIKFLNKSNPMKRTDLPEMLKKSLKAQNTLARLDHRLKDFKEYLQKQDTIDESYRTDNLKELIMKLVPRAFENIKRDLECDEAGRRMAASIEILRLIPNIK